MRLKKFIPFGPYAPDRSRRDVGALRKAENVIPVWGSYSVVPQIEVKSTTDVGGNISGAHVHFYTVSAGDQFGYPVSNAANVDGNWVALYNEENSLYEQIDNRGEDDNTRILCPAAHDDVTARTAVIKCANLDPPVITTGTREFKYRYRVDNHDNSGGDWSLIFSLQRPAGGATLDITTTITGSADTAGWIDDEITMTTTTLDDVLTTASWWDDLWFEIIATVPGSGPQIKYPSENKRNDDKFVDETGVLASDPDSLTDDTDTTYLQSPDVPPGEDAKIDFWWAGSESDNIDSDTDPRIHDIDGLGDSGHTLSVRWKANVTDVKGDIQLFENPKNEADGAIAESLANALTTSFAETSIALTPTEVEEIDDYTQLYTRVRFYNDATSQATADASETYPTYDVNVSSGVNVSNPPWYSNLGDDANTVVISNVAGQPDGKFEVGFPTITDNGEYEDWKVVIEAKSGADKSNLEAYIQYGNYTGSSNRIVLQEVRNISTSYTEYEKALTEDQARNLIEDQHNLELRIFNRTSQTDTLTVRRAYISGPSTRYGQVSEVKFTIPDNARAQVSQVQARVPTQYAYRVGDKVEVYAGVPTKLYQVLDDEDHIWDDVTRDAGATPYNDFDTGTTDHALSWDFCSFGEDILATNFIDPVQKKGPSDTDFSALIVGDEKPQGKFINVVADFVVLGNLSSEDLTNQDSGQPDEVWWSAINDATSWEPDPVTQCDRQRLVPTPGEITGMVGGEFGIIFKQSSIYRMNYVGSPQIFTFDILSRTVGTKYPQSIIPVNNDIYFYGQSGFYVVKNGEMVVPIDAGLVNRTLQDRQFESNSIREFFHKDEREKNSYVIGGYDPVSKLLYWAIRRKSNIPAEDSDDYALLTGENDLYAYRNDFLLVYNPEENRFTTIGDSAKLRAAFVGALPDTASGERIDRNMFILNMGEDDDKTNTVASVVSFSSAEDRYAATFKTNVIAATALLGENATGHNVTIRRVRPIYWEQPENTIGADADRSVRINISITVRVSDDPLMYQSQSDTAAVTDYIDDRDRDGWFPVQLMAGEFFDVEIEFDTNPTSGVREILGFEIDYDIHGEY